MVRFARRQFYVVLAILALNAPGHPGAEAHHARHPDEAGSSGKEADNDRRRKAALFTSAMDRMVQACSQEAADLKKMRLPVIAEFVRLTDEQKSALENVRISVNGAADALAAGCPQHIAGNLSGKIDTLDMALELMANSLGSVRPALTAFYSSLDDEQKVRLSTVEVPDTPPAKPAHRATQKQQSTQKQQGAQKQQAADDLSNASAKPLCAEWAANLRNFPIQQIEAEMQLSDEQHAALHELAAVIYRSAGDLAEACPVENRVTPTGRLDARMDELQALREDIDAIKPAAAAFENALNEAQRNRLADAVNVSPVTH